MKKRCISERENGNFVVNRERVKIMEKPHYMSDRAWSNVLAVLNLETTGELAAIQKQVLTNHEEHFTDEDYIMASREMAEGHQSILLAIEKAS
jgi:hypothetical protein